MEKRVEDREEWAVILKYKNYKNCTPKKKKIYVLLLRGKFQK
jgi:hypothetical protein